MVTTDRSQLVTIATLVNNAGGLFTLPDICLELQALVNDPNSNAEIISHLLSADPALTARILKVANSALFGFSSTISSMQKAITLLGTREINSLAIATYAAQTFSVSGGGMLNMKDFWHKSILVGLINQELGNLCSPRIVEGLFVAGLLHNIGSLLALEQVSHLASSAFQKMDKLQPFWEREENVFGFTFAELGGSLLQHWKLPERITLPILHQHQPLQAGDYIVDAWLLAASVRLATDLTKAEADKINYLGSLPTAMLDGTGISAHDIINAGEAAEAKVSEVTRIFFD